MNFNGDFKSLGEVDVTKLRQAVSSISDARWIDDEKRQQTYENIHQHTQTIGLIYDDDMRHTDVTVHPAYRDFEELVKPIEEHVSAFYETQGYHVIESRRNQQPYFARIILVRLKVGGFISKHKDGSATMRRCHRIHLPIITNPEVAFDVGESSMGMAEGELWEINNRREHAVANHGEEDRVHLIFDYVIAGEKIRDTKGFVIC